MMAFMAVMTMSFTACSDDDDDVNVDSEKLIAYDWYMVSQTWEEEDGTHTSTYDKGEGGYIFFRTDGTVNMSKGKSGDEIMEWSGSYSWNYRISGSNIIVSREYSGSGGEYTITETWKVLSMTDDTLTLRWEDKDENLAITCKFEKN